MPARRLSAFGAVVALTAMAVIAGPASPAAAHNTVIAVGPKDGSTVVTQPETVWLQTNDALLDVEGAGAMDVVGPDGLHYAGGCPAITGAIASVPAELGPAGEYTVVWRVVSADGHPISGEFDFDWEPADGEPLAEGAAESTCESSGSGAVEPGAQTEGEADAAGSGAASDLLWIGGAVLVALVAAGVAFLLIRRRDDDDGPDDAGSPDSAGPEDQATATGASDERPESARTD